MKKIVFVAQPGFEYKGGIIGFEYKYKGGIIGKMESSARTSLERAVSVLIEEMCKKLKIGTEIPVSEPSSLHRRSFVTFEGKAPSYSADDLLRKIRVLKNDVPNGSMEMALLGSCAAKILADHLCMVKDVEERKSFVDALQHISVKSLSKGTQTLSGCGNYSVDWKFEGWTIFEEFGGDRCNEPAGLIWEDPDTSTRVYTGLEL